MEVLESLEKLRLVSGNEQIELLNSLKTNLLKEILEYTYDTHKKYKIDESKYNKISQHHGLLSAYTNRNFNEKEWIEFKGILNNLAEIKSASDKTVAKVKNFIETIEEENAKNFLKMVLFKDLRLNMNVKKMQKVWPDFLVEPQVQLAKPKEDREDFINGRYSRKFDGKRVWFSDYIPMSRTNKQCTIPPIQHIIDELKSGPEELSKYVLDGELLYFENGKEDFQKGISLCQRDDRLPGCDNICYVIFDIIDKEKFYLKEPTISFEKEYQEIINLFYKEGTSPCYSLLPTYFPHVYIARQDKDPSILMRLRKENNWEGLMYRNADVSYEYKRTNNLLKIKEMQDLEVKLVDMEIGTGKHEGRLGAFIADYRGNELKIGSGFTDEQREKYWNNKDEYIGKYVKVQYFEKTKNQDGTDSLRFPVFLCFRDPVTMEEYI